MEFTKAVFEILGCYRSRAEVCVESVSCFIRKILGCMYKEYRIVLLYWFLRGFCQSEVVQSFEDNPQPDQPKRAGSELDSISNAEHPRSPGHPNSLNRPDIFGTFPVRRQPTSSFMNEGIRVGLHPENSFTPPPVISGLYRRSDIEDDRV